MLLRGHKVPRDAASKGVDPGFDPLPRFFWRERFAWVREKVGRGEAYFADETLLQRFFLICDGRQFA